MKILVTGATGFIGNHLINNLLQNSSYDVIASSRDEKKAKTFSWYKKVQYISYDFDKTDCDNVYQFFNRPDKMIHLGWDRLDNYNNLIHIENFLLKHSLFIKNILKHGLKDLTVAGTCLEYGLQEGCLSEEMNTKPSNSYAIAKDSLRKYIVELKKELNFDYKWIRLFYMFGAGQSEKSLISLLENSIKNHDEKFNMSGGEQLRDFLFIDDVVKNISSIVDQDIYTNQVINCCSGKPISVRKFVEDYLQQRKYTLELNLGYYPYPDYEPMAFWGDCRKLNVIKNMKNESKLNNDEK